MQFYFQCAFSLLSKGAAACMQPLLSLRRKTERRSKEQKFPLVPPPLRRDSRGCTQGKGGGEPQRCIRDQSLLMMGVGVEDIFGKA